MPCRALVIALGMPAACSKPAGEQQQEAFTRACIAVTAKRPATMATMAGLVGGEPAECVLSPGSCVCSWRFFTTAGMREIAGVAEYQESSGSAPDASGGVRLVNVKTNQWDDVPADQVARAYQARTHAFASKDELVPIKRDGKIYTVPARDLHDSLASGAIVAYPEYRKAELEAKYSKVPLTERISMCLAANGGIAWVQLGDDQPIFYRAQ